MLLVEMVCLKIKFVFFKFFNSFYLIKINQILSILKTRVFVTNSLTFLPDCDRIFVIDNGTITVFNSFDELIKREDFSEFLGKNLKSPEEKDKEEGD